MRRLIEILEIKIVTKRSCGFDKSSAINCFFQFLSFLKDRTFKEERENKAVSEQDKKEEINKRKDKISKNTKTNILSFLKNNFFLPFWHES